MAYLFGSANTDKIAAGTPGRASTFTLWARLKLAAADTAGKGVVCFRTATLVQAQLLFYDPSVSNVLIGTYTTAGTPHSVTWTTGFTAGTIHTVALTYDGTWLALWADTDVNGKAADNPATTPDQDANSVFYMGNSGASDTVSLAGTLYEVGWWPGTVLTGAELAGMGAGTPPSTPPSNYWPLVSDAVAIYGGLDGTVTGAAVVAHSGSNLYSGTPPETSVRTIHYHGA